MKTSQLLENLLDGTIASSEEIHDCQRELEAFRIEAESSKALFRDLLGEINKAQELVEKLIEDQKGANK